MEEEDVWRRLAFPKKTVDVTREMYATMREEVVMEAVYTLPDAAKELTLMVTSTRTCDHRSLAERLYRSGYNVTVEMNGTNAKNFRVCYVNKSAGISVWDIPFKQIDLKADKGDLESYTDRERNIVDTGIFGKEDYTMAHVLQSALFMMTDAEKRIVANVSVEEFRKLEAIAGYIAMMDKKLRRPKDYPKVPRVALIAGHLAGRGITFQNPGIDFTCTSFCFTDTRDMIQRGAVNTQRFGRACGQLMDVFAREGRKPVLIATEGIMKDALANEEALREKAESIENGTLISLKDLVTKADWDRVVKKTKEAMMMEERSKKKLEKGGEIVDGVCIKDLQRYVKTKKMLLGRMIRFLDAQEGPVTIGEFKEAIGYEKSMKQFINNVDNGRGVNTQYGKLWTCVDGMVEINANIKKFL